MRPANDNAPLASAGEPGAASPQADLGGRPSERVTCDPLHARLAAELAPRTPAQWQALEDLQTLIILRIATRATLRAAFPHLVVTDL